MAWRGLANPCLELASLLWFVGGAISAFLCLIFPRPLDPSFGSISNSLSLSRCKNPINLILKFGLHQMHGLSLPIWDISIMGHWDTLVLLNSRLWASDVDWTTIPPMWIHYLHHPW